MDLTLVLWWSKNLIFNMEFEVMTRDAGIQRGSYLFTIDNYHHRNEPDFTLEMPDSISPTTLWS